MLRQQPDTKQLKNVIQKPASTVNSENQNEVSKKPKASIDYLTIASKVLEILYYIIHIATLL